MDSIDSVNKLSSDTKLETLKELYNVIPEIFTEDYKVDLKKLEILLGENIEDINESFSFNWKGKSDAIRVAHQPTSSTIKPNKNKSVDWNSTDNIYIEGDNLEVLKIIQKAYHNQVKVIYIDPPYNTGKDFVYEDNYKEPIEDYLRLTKQINEEGYRYKSNTEKNGRFHSDWLNMMYPRLKLARNLLREDGVIFISIDDTEQANLKKMADEIFGEKNFMAQITWERAYSPVNLKKNFSENHDYILAYAKNIDNVTTNGLKRNEEANNRYSNPDNDIRGVWKSSDLSVGPANINNIYEITTPSGRTVMPPSGYSWRLSRKRFDEFVDDNRIWFGPKGDATPSIKRFLSEVKQTIVPMTIWKYKEVGHSQSASKHLKQLFDNRSYFSYPKPVDLVKRIIELYSDKDSIILDFFSGSGTTAEATMKMNSEDGGKRKFILVQLPEALDQKEVAYKDGYNTITDIGEERIRRAGKSFNKKSIEKDLDTGFKVFELSSSTLKTWNPEAEDIIEEMDFLIDTVASRTDYLSVVYEIMLKQGLDLSNTIKKYNFKNYTVYYIGKPSMIVIIGKEITFDVVEFLLDKKEIIKNKVPIVFQDAGFKSDGIKLNIIEQLKNAGISIENIMSF